MSITPETGYEITVTDEHWRSLDAALIPWELGAGRSVRVQARFACGAGYGRQGTAPEAFVRIFEHEDEMPGRRAVVVPPAGGVGLRPELVPAFLDVLRRAQEIAAEANDRIAGTGA